MNDSFDSASLVRVCQLLNEAGARYIVAGAYAMILNRAVRATEDVDILIEKSTDSYARAIAGLSQMTDGAAAELTPRDFEENVVIKIADEVDVCTHAWTVTYEEASPNAQLLTIDGIDIPYLSLRDLIRSKETYQDRIGVERLRGLLE